ncbi:MAG TPA: bifunctional DNA primase/polymerase, partial [Jatrophihabitans sp.]|nr:bifunctional DNA primase/polymerase [Jatrophihabitans sp.]
MTSTDTHPALDHAARGWHVFPIRERGKQPIVKWREWATTDPAKIAAEFAARSCNVGIACGPSRLLVIDEDSADAFAKFAASIGVELPETYTVRTGRGRHFYFGMPHSVELGNAEGALKDRGLNVRGVGGYVVAAGSMHANGTSYVADHPERTPAPCPAWLTGALRGPATSTGSSDARGLAAVPEVIRGPRSDAPGQRHDVLVGYACSLRARDVPR